MKPVTLSMQAYGPYAGLQELDFRKLADTSLYLICGETGAGKSTIFDAIAYALYGEDAGTGNLHRSKYANEDTETFVRLVFIHQGKQWQITRKPFQVLTKRRGTGTREFQPSVEMCCPDGRTVTRIEQVKEEVTQLLGLTAAQFKQVIMIAQGKFDQVLHTKADDRQRILRNIMDTSFFVRLQERLREDARKARDETAVLEEHIHAYKATVQIPADHPMADQALLLTQPGTLPEEALQAVEAVIEADARALTVEERQQEALQDAFTDAGLQCQLARKAEQVRRTIAETEDGIRKLTDDKSAQEEAVAAARSRQEEARSLRSEAAALRAELPRFDQLEQLEQERGRLQQTLEGLVRDADKAGRRAGEIRQQHSGAQEEERTLRDVPDLLLAASQRKNELKRLGQDLAKTRDDAKALARQNVLAQRAQEAYLRADADYRAEYQRYDDLQQLHVDAQAGILAVKKLRVGKACPVCGSVDHPCPAPPPPADVPDEAALKQAREAAEKLRDARDAASRKAGEAVATRAAAEETLAADLRVLPEDLRAGLPDSPSALTAEALEPLLQHTRSLYQDADREVNSLQAKQDRLTALRQLLPDLASRLQQAQEALHQAQQSQTQTRTLLEEKTGQADTLRRQLPFPSRQVLLDRQKQAEHDAQQIEDSLRRADDLLAKTMERLAALGATLTSNRDQLQELPTLSLAEAEARQEAARQAHQEAQDRTAALKGRLNTNRQQLQKLRSAYQTLAAKEARQAWLESLSKTASGLCSDWKITLEGYVQLRLFDRILHRANQHLSRMSDGQYTLVRAGGKPGSRSSSLDLDVIDSTNGTQRDSVTLSGGESFQASLALALGFSDEIQSNAGGIQLDTLFIDEGFGTLSEDWLNRAIATLQDLSGSSRQVGIISHVADLQRRIERKIVVRRDPRKLGSTAEIL